MRQLIRNKQFDHAITFSIIIFVLFLFMTMQLSAQEVKSKIETDTKSGSNKYPNETQATGDEIIFKDESNNSLIKITDEGSVGSITIPSGSAPSSTSNKLYNEGGTLKFNGSSLGSGGGAGQINDLTDAKYDGSSLFIGEDAGANDDGNNSNTAIGKLSLNLNTSGNSNTAVGISALRENTTGGHNTALGSASLVNNTTGNYNTSLGRLALSNNSSGSNNLSLGYFSMSKNTVGSKNIALGGGALFENISGNRNISIGNGANYFSQNGSNNTIIGYDAGRGTSIHSKSGNVFLGFQAGYNETGSNKLYIENSNSSDPLIYGDFTNGSELVRINGNLNVTGYITSLNPIGGMWDANGNEILLGNPSVQYVGIGTEITETSAKLHVKGNEGVLFQGTHGNGTALNFGAGTRYHFYPKKSAIRGGNVNSTQWDDANIGIYSVAFGGNTTASGAWASALCKETTASGEASFSAGAYTIASGAFSTAFGNVSKAESYVSTAIGRFNIGGGNATTWIETDPLFEIGNGDFSKSSNAVTVLKNGKVGIGTNSTTYRVEIKAETGENPLKVKVNNSGKLTVFSNGGTSIGTDAAAPINGLLVAGDIRNTGGLLHSSDIRFKDNIEKIPSTLAHIQNLRGVYYNWKIDEFPDRNFNDKRQIGVIAQEVEKEFPEIVDTDEEGYKSVDYTKLSAILIEAVKEQNLEFRNENAKLLEKIKELENQLNKIESFVIGKKFATVSNE